MCQAVDEARPSHLELRRLIRRHFGGSLSLPDEDLDRAFGIRRTRTEARLSLLEMLEVYGVRRLDAGDHPYDVVRAILRRVLRDGGEDLLDLGSGYGRVCLYAGAMGLRSVAGIEIVKERVREARRAARASGLTQVRFVHGAVEKAEWPPSSTIVLLNSFSPGDLKAVLTRLRALARERQLTVFAVSTAAEMLAALPWLRESRFMGGLPSLRPRRFRSL